MRLESVEYSEFENTPQEWSLEGLRLGDEPDRREERKGRPRVLNIINSLAHSLAGLRRPGLSGHYDVVFTEDGKRLTKWKLTNNKW